MVRVKRISAVIVIMMMAIVLMIPSPIMAASKLPYKDVNKKTCDAESIKAIKTVYYYGGYNGVIKGQKFKPNKKVTKREFIAILANLYGKENVPVNINDVLGANAKVKPKWACNKLTAVGEKISGDTITWDKIPKNKLTRAAAARYIKIFIDFDSSFQPR